MKSKELRLKAKKTKSLKIKSKKKKKFKRTVFIVFSVVSWTFSRYFLSEENDPKSFDKKSTQKRSVKINNHD